MEDKNLRLKEEVKNRIEKEKKLHRKRQDLNEFVSFISHDVNNSLLAIDGYLSYYLENNDTELLHRAKKRIQLISDLIEKSILMVETGMQLSIKENVNLDLLIEKLASVTIPKTITFTKDTLGSVSCDPIKISQVFTNLFDNFIKHGNPKNI